MPVIHNGEPVFIRNSLFNTPVGRYTWDNEAMRAQPIVGLLATQGGSTQFDFFYIKDDRYIIKSGRGLVGEDGGYASVYTSGNPQDCEWVVEHAGDGGGYIIRWGKEPELVWTLNAPTEPGNQVHLELYDTARLRQVWDIVEVET